jgi:hypothetical protein
MSGAMHSVFLGLQTEVNPESIVGVFSLNSMSAISAFAHPWRIAFPQTTGETRPSRLQDGHRRLAHPVREPDFVGKMRNAIDGHRVHPANIEIELCVDISVITCRESQAFGLHVILSG